LKQNGEEGVPEVVDFLLHRAVELGSTDLHLECFRERVLIKYRIDGKLLQVASLAKEYQENIIARLKILSRVASFKTREPQDGSIRLTRTDNDILVLRSSFLPTLYGEKVVVRIPDPMHVRFELDSLGMSSEMQTNLISLLRSLQGTILLTGPGSSGKTTSIYSLLRYMHAHFYDTINIMTVEDPIEGSLDGVNQTQIDMAAGLDYARALKSMLRQDPNVLVIGEVRDTETAHIAIEAGLTGHMVISTIHSGEAVGVVVRLLNMGIEPFMVASSVTGVIAQRLVRVVCDECRVEREASEAEKKLLGIPLDSSFKVSEGKGCASCNFSGFKGRTGIFEFLYINDRMRDLILQKPSTEQIRRHALESGMTTLREDALRKIREGKTAPSEVMHLFYHF